ncbi:hypothetical protein GCM10010191_59040 [Actinomadura vinacea]|uniref:Uncharacterized protein n=1 Tax=Actinomadura vinacea TaxID=115336 RepID=A0ABN3JSG6_9ACTN
MAQHQDAQPAGGLGVAGEAFGGHEQVDAMLPQQLEITAVRHGLLASQPIHQVRHRGAVEILPAQDLGGQPRREGNEGGRVAVV